VTFKPAQNGQQIPHRLWERRTDIHNLAGPWVMECQTVGMQRLAAKLRDCRIDFDIPCAANPAIEGVADDWVPSKLAVHTNLVGPPGVEAAFPKRTRPERLAHNHFGDGFTTDALR
jgi:hypothetical protein